MAASIIWAARCARPLARPAAHVLGKVAAAWGAGKVIRAIWNIPQVRISRNTTELAASLEHAPNEHVDLVLSELEGADGADLGRILARECYAGNPTPGRRRARMSAFYRHWVAVVRLEFPLRANRASDRGAMSKWLHGQMKATGMRASHMADAVPKVVRLAMNPSRAEQEAEQMADEAMLRTTGSALWRRVARWPLRLVGLGPREPRETPPGFG